MQKQTDYLMDQNRVLSCFDVKSGHLPIKKMSSLKIWVYMVVVVFSSVFHSEVYQNNILLLFFKNYFWY